jgi:hypothetical protein
VKKEDKSCSGRWNKLTGCGKFGLIWYLFWLSPFILEGSIWLLILGTLIPIGFGFGLIKHRAPILWFFILVIVNIGGLADLTADVWLLLRTILYYVTNYSVNPFGDMSSEEFHLVLIRLIVTLITGVPSVIFLFFMNSDAWVAFTGEKKANVAKGGNAVTALCLMVIWKLAMIFARVTIIWQIFRSLIKHKKITEETEKSTKFWEIAATLEVLWSAVPLGILTALEAFYFEDISHVTPTKIWELIKLGALVIDLIGVSYFCYFDMFGMDKCLATGEHTHHDASINQASDEKSPLIVASDSNV